MDDPDDAILYLFPHNGEGFDGAEFATAMPENKSRFLAGSPSDALKRRDIPRQERGGTELPVKRGLFENTDYLAFQNIPVISNFHLTFTFDDQYRLIASDLGSRGGTKVIYSKEEGER